MKNLILLCACVVFGVVHLQGQMPTAAPTVTPKPKAPWELEWAYRSKYRDADRALGAPKAGEQRVVFMGDSITEAWERSDPAFFTSNDYIDRGISGQTTAQMLVRFRQDVIALKPVTVVILGGTNDIAQNGGLTTLEAIEENLQSMVELAQANGIRVVLAAVLPAFDYPWRRGLEPAEKIFALNRWIAAFCAEKHIGCIDYYSPMVDTANKGLKAELSKDGVHPNAAGYAIMEPLARKAVAAAL